MKKRSKAWTQTKVSTFTYADVVKRVAAGDSTVMLVSRMFNVPYEEVEDDVEAEAYRLGDQAEEEEIRK